MDPATLLAITSDYNLDDESELEGVRQILDAIAASAEFEEATGFDPSGSSGAAAPEAAADAHVNDAGENTTRSERNSSSETDLTWTTDSVFALSLGHDDETMSMSTEAREREAETDQHIRELQPLGKKEKEAVLVDMFPGLKEFDIQWALKRHGDDMPKTVEDLLNQTFLEETGGRHRGIEGFSENGDTKKSKKSRKSRSQAACESLNGFSDVTPTPTASAWETRKQDLEVLTRLCGLDSTQASILYQQKSARLWACLKQMLENYKDVPMDLEHGALEELTRLMKQFPELPEEKLTTILAICGDSNSSPEEFCSVLLPGFDNPEPTLLPTIKLDYKLAASTNGDNWNDVPAKRTIKPTRSTVSYADAATDYRALRNGYFEKANAAYRKARSDPLMGGVAAYYSQEGRDYNAKAKSIYSAATDALVAQQSTDRQLDLHGIGVLDAVRIARESVTMWWTTVDHQGSHAGYTIITGKGTHSVNGVANIRNAVGRMLIREGWKANIGSGSILVRGTTGIKKLYTR